MGDLNELVERLKAATDELRRLSSCGDIPRYRRKQLLSLADTLSPEAFPAPYPAPDVFCDGYYRRPGMRMKAHRSEAAVTPNVAPAALLTALSLDTNKGDGV